MCHPRTVRGTASYMPRDFSTGAKTSVPFCITYNDAKAVCGCCCLHAKTWVNIVSCNCRNYTCAEIRDPPHSVINVKHAVKSSPRTRHAHWRGNEAEERMYWSCASDISTDKCSSMFVQQYTRTSLCLDPFRSISPVQCTVSIPHAVQGGVKKTLWPNLVNKRSVVDPCPLRVWTSCESSIVFLLHL